MKKALLLHGAYGTPDENWLPWLKLQLETLGFSVIVPAFPTPEGQNLAAWMDIVEPHLQDLEPESILVGHSIGATFLLSVLERLKGPVNAAVLVAGFISNLDNATFDRINSSFYNKEFDWHKITSAAHKIIALHGDNDPYVSQKHAAELAGKLGVETHYIPAGGHLNEAAGFTHFAELLELTLDFEARKALLAPVNDSGEIFIQDRRNHKKPDWGYFGGSIERYESAIEAVIREAKEELAITIAPNELIEVAASVIPTASGSRMRYMFLYPTDQKNFTVLEGAGGEWLGIDAVYERFAGQPGLHTLNDLKQAIALLETH